uniref:Uncharacterized protein n=1 Tax=Chromera velia CCMP2878 TaxID=1169474 RepID=A0A0G4HCC7_9ALVE|eukprot:Cvel_26040.t1-p1 / transcript=Cvel_26040.t1 / gene=Cvel_26040 / organism=Chromera_velia_CCMP2878 / gene_product=hypothetical protein / transcript_product=hypothetical protein / location=Cvel_scaffold3034:2782-3096(+) / protein_length=105 / sequence_SO=supercontig / SO=protein_coding / is_pseudo=false
MREKGCLDIHDKESFDRIFTTCVVGGSSQGNLTLAKCLEEEGSRCTAHFSSFDKRKQEYLKEISEIEDSIKEIEEQKEFFKESTESQVEQKVTPPSALRGFAVLE